MADPGQSSDEDVPRDVPTRPPDKSSSEDDEDVPLKSLPPADLDLDLIEQQVLHAMPSSSSRPGPPRPPGRLYDPSTKSLGDQKSTSVCYAKLTRGTCSKPDVPSCIATTLL
jgi:hypothetical protein